MKLVCGCVFNHLPVCVIFGCVCEEEKGEAKERREKKENEGGKK